MKNFVKFAVAGAAAIAMSISAASATVTSYANATDLFNALGVTTNPSTWTLAINSDNSNTDIGNQSPPNVEAKLESAAWFNQNLTFVGGGACGLNAFQNGCSQNGSGAGTTNLTGNVIGIHYGNNFIAFLFDSAVNPFSIEGLRNGVSNIYVFNTDNMDIPIPGAIWLMGAGLAGLGFAGRKKKA